MTDASTLPPPVRPPARAFRVAQHHACGAIAEQRRRDEHRLARIGDTQAQGAKIDGEKEHMGTRHALRVTGRPGKPRDAAAESPLSAKSGHRATSGLSFGKSRSMRNESSGPTTSVIW